MAQRCLCSRLHCLKACNQHFDAHVAWCLQCECGHVLVCFTSSVDQATHASKCGPGSVFLALHCMCIASHVDMRHWPMKQPICCCGQHPADPQKVLMHWCMWPRCNISTIVPLFFWHWHTPLQVFLWAVLGGMALWSHVTGQWEICDTTRALLVAKSCTV